MKPLNICVVVGCFPAISETFIVNQIVSLINKGHQVSIYALNKGDKNIVHSVSIEYDLLDKVSYQLKRDDNYAIRIIQFLIWVLKHFFHIKWSYFFKSINFFKYSKRALSLDIFFKSQYFLLKQNDFDVIHVHFGIFASSIVQLKEIGFMKQTKLVVSFHGFDINPSEIDYYKKRYKPLFKQSNCITVNTIYTKKLLEKVNTNINKLSVLPVGLDTNLFRKSNDYKRTNRVFKIVYCGRLLPFKGSLLLPKIITELNRRGYVNVELIIIGNGGLKEDLKNEIIKRKLQDSIFMVGAIKQNEIIKIFEKSNVFLLPGIYNVKDGRAENQGLVIQEAQAMELPVVVSDVGGMKYGLIENNTGFVVKENDIKGFADKIEFLINNPEKAIQMGIEGRKFVVKNYDSNVLVDKLISIYKS